MDVHDGTIEKPYNLKELQTIALSTGYNKLLGLIVCVHGKLHKVTGSIHDYIMTKEL